MDNEDKEATRRMERALSDPLGALHPSMRLSKVRVEASQTMSDMPLVGENPTPLDEERIQRAIENNLIANLEQAKAFKLSDLLPVLTQGVEVIVQDDFSRCFASSRSDAWNWNVYLCVLWCMGVLVRYCILFPLRVFCLLGGFGLLSFVFVLVKMCVKDHKRRAALERMLIRWICSVFVFSWTGVIKYHHTIPDRKPNRIYVANHTSMIDMIILSQMHTFAIVGQKHPGWVGVCQESLLGCLGCCWFDRTASKDRQDASTRIKAHISNTSANRLLVFPEGTCVNNEYCVQFKRGVFDIGAEVCPIAIKYNKIFVDAYWNSRSQSFLMHLVTLMCSWAVVCDVWYLPPQTQRADESGIDFSNRVKKMIAAQAGLKDVDWDGYLKHFRPSARYVQQRQEIFAQSLLKRLNISTPAQSRRASQVGSANSTNISSSSPISVGSAISKGHSAVEPVQERADEPPENDARDKAQSASQAVPASRSRKKKA